MISASNLKQINYDSVNVKNRGKENEYFDKLGFLVSQRKSTLYRPRSIMCFYILTYSLISEMQHLYLHIGLCII
jgi:hypothetical protein